jgi:hypothetical protein
MLWVSWAILLTGATPEEIAAVEDRVIANRMAVKSWHVRVSYSFPIGGTDAERGYIAITSFLDGSRQREDSTMAYEKHERFPGLKSDHYETYHIYKPEEDIAFGTSQSPTGAVRALEIISKDRGAANPVDDSLKVFDVRWIAWHSEGSLVPIPMTDVLRNPRYVNREMIDETLRGVACKKLTFGLEGTQGITDDKNSVWIAPEMGYSILEYRLDYHEGAVQIANRTTVEVQEWKNTGIWFPVASVCEKTTDGRVTYRQEATIEVYSLNEPLDSKHFTASALNVPIGRAVYVQPNPEFKNRVWDGEKVVELKLPAGGLPATPSSQSTMRRWLLLLSALVLIIVGIVSFWKYNPRH